MAIPTICLLLEGVDRPNPLDLDSAWTDFPSDADWIGLTGAAQEHTSALTNALTERLQNSSADVLVVPHAPSVGQVDRWKELPAPLAALLPKPHQTGVLLFRTSARQSNSPWRMLVDLAADAARFHVAAPLETPHAIPAERLNPLTPTRSTCPAWMKPVWDDTIDALAPRASRIDRLALKAGWLQMHDALDESHSLSQEIEGEGEGEGFGDYWHAINHRREPDYGNAKYWFRRVGRHPVIEQMATILQSGALSPLPTGWEEKLSRGGWDSSAFVDLCEQAARLRELENVARRIQDSEMNLLLKATWSRITA
jgi:hypothetical protein